MPDTATNTFSKSERIVSRRLMEQLFTKGNGKSMVAYPLRVVYMNVDKQTAAAQVLVSVSKRHFKRAVKRNRVKRQIRESYRLNKQLLSGVLSDDKTLAIAFIWLADELQDSRTVTKCMRKLLSRIAETECKQ